MEELLRNKQNFKELDYYIKIVVRAPSENELLYNDLMQVYHLCPWQKAKQNKITDLDL